MGKSNWLPGLFLMVGLVFLGAMAPVSVSLLKSYDRNVTVKGLCEREVAADKVIWPLVIKVAGNDLSQVYASIDAKNEIIRNFLLDGGLRPENITFGSISVSDTQTESYNNDRHNRFLAKSVVTVCSSDVSLVRSLMARQNELLSRGVVIAQDWENSTVFSYEGLNDIKPDMIEEATKNARAAAQKFAADSGSRLGKIKTATQGNFSISDRDDDTPWIKNVRVVNSVTYYLKD